MASTFKFHSQVQETVPWNAQYTFPTQATKVQKQVVKLPAKNGSSFTAGQIVRIEFPADNYLNVLNSYLTFDLTFAKSTATRLGWQRGGAQNVIKRLRVLYGSLVIEDIQEYKTLVRLFHECAIPQDYRESSGSILDGMHANTNVEPGASYLLPAGASPVGRLTYGQATAGSATTITLQAANNYSTSDDAYANCFLQITGGTGVGQIFIIDSYVGSTRVATFSPQPTVVATIVAPDNTSTYSIFGAGSDPVLSAADVAKDIACAFEANDTKRTYCLNLLSGLLTQKKLIPLKWMAAQLSIEITLASTAESCLYDGGSPTYTLADPYFVAEMMEFDSTYDQAFFMGLTQGGVPLKFSSWHYHSFNVSGNNNTIQIHERSRSVKAAFAVFRDSNAVAGDGKLDSDRFMHAPGQTFTLGVIDAGTMKTAQVEEFQWRVGGRYYPSQPVRGLYGAPEAYVELQKAVNIFGDYTSATAINVFNWSTHGAGVGDKFIMACEFENTDVMPGTIAGINAEEQSDIALRVKTTATIPASRQLDVFMHYDTLLVVRDGNVVDLIM